MQKTARRKKLVDSRLQLRLIGVFLCVSCVASLFQVVQLNRALVALSERLEVDGDTVMAELPGILEANVLWTMGALFPLTFLVGLLVTHRIAGPAFRMRQHCLAIARGEETGPCRIRERDELGDLCDALNAAVAALEVRSGVEPGTEPLKRSA